MAECRFFPECQRCNETGDSWLPCDGGADGTRCEGYEPMPDVESLLALADEMDRDGKIQRTRQKDGEHWFIDGLDVKEYARRIREACGEVER